MRDYFEQTSLIVVYWISTIFFGSVHYPGLEIEAHELFPVVVEQWMLFHIVEQPLLQQLQHISQSKSRLGRRNCVQGLFLEEEEVLGIGNEHQIIILVVALLYHLKDYPSLLKYDAPIRPDSSYDVQQASEVRTAPNWRGRLIHLLLNRQDFPPFSLLIVFDAALLLEVSHSRFPSILHPARPHQIISS